MADSSLTGDCTSLNTAGTELGAGCLPVLPVLKLSRLDKMSPQLLDRPCRRLRIAAGVETEVEAAWPPALHVADHGGAEQHGVERVHVGLHILSQQSLQGVQRGSEPMGSFDHIYHGAKCKSKSWS